MKEDWWTLFEKSPPLLGVTLHILWSYLTPFCYLSIYLNKYVFSCGEKHCPPPIYRGIGPQHWLYCKAIIHICICASTLCLSGRETAFSNNQAHWHKKILSLSSMSSSLQAKNTCVSSLLSQLRTSFWPKQPKFNGKLSRQRPDASVDVYGCAFGAILANRRLVF